MKIKIDMHVHPSLPKKEEKALAKAEKWWRELMKKGIRCIISAEHCYRNPGWNYEIMQKTSPEGFFVFPGAELLSMEGVDLIVFHKDKSIYDDEKLIKPWNMKIEDMINYIEKKGYEYFIPHPFTLGKTSIFKIGSKRSAKILESAKSIEAHNTCMKQIRIISEKIRLSNIFRKKYKKMLMMENVPSEYLKNIKFISGGSDAHRPSCIGSCMIIESKSESFEDVFKALISNKKDNFISEGESSLAGLAISSKEALSDWASKTIKRR